MVDILIDEYDLKVERVTGPKKRENRGKEAVVMRRQKKRKKKRKKLKKMENQVVFIEWTKFGGGRG